MNLSLTTRELLKDATYFNDRIKSAAGKDVVTERRYCRALIFASWSALEGWVNYVCSDFAKLPEPKLSAYERAFLMEKRISITEDGEVHISNQDSYQKTLAKLCYVLKKFGGYSFPKDSDLWRQLKEAQRIRHCLVHPKMGAPDIRIDARAARLFLDVTKQTILLLASKIYGKKLKLPI